MRTCHSQSHQLRAPSPTPKSHRKTRGQPRGRLVDTSAFGRGENPRLTSVRARTASPPTSPLAKTLSKSACPPPLSTRIGQAMHTDQSSCEVWRSSLTRTHPQPYWAEARVWHGCVLLSPRSEVDPSGHSEHVREPAREPAREPSKSSSSKPRPSKSGSRWLAGGVLSGTFTNRRVESAHTHTRTHIPTHTHTHTHVYISTCPMMMIGFY